MNCNHGSVAVPGNYIKGVKLTNLQAGIPRCTRTFYCICQIYIVIAKSLEVGAFPSHTYPGLPLTILGYLVQLLYNIKCKQWDEGKITWVQQWVFTTKSFHFIFYTHLFWAIKISLAILLYSQLISIWSKYCKSQQSKKSKPCLLWWITHSW